MCERCHSGQRQGGKKIDLRHSRWPSAALPRAKWQLLHGFYTDFLAWPQTLPHHYSPQSA